MAEAALVEEEEKSQFTLEDEGPLSIENPEDLLSSKEPDPIEGVPSALIDTSEQTVSDMAGVTSYKDIKFKAELQDTERRNRAINASIFNIKTTTPDALRIIRNIANTPLIKRTNGEAVAEILARGHSKPSKKQLAHGLDVATGQQITKQGVEKSLNFPPGSFNKSMASSSDVAKSVATHFQGHEGWEDVDSLNDLIEFFNPIGGGEKEAMDIDFWDTVKDVFTLEFDADEFDKKMTSNWGEDWGWKWGGWLAKEAVIDTAILGMMIAFTPLGGIMALSQVGLRANFLASVLRTAAISGGGTAAQMGQYAIIDRETDVQGELVGRALGQGFFEVLGQGVKAGYKAFKGRTSKEATSINAKEDGTKPLTEAQLKEALSPEAALSTHSSLTRAQLEGVVTNYNKATSDIADALTNKNLTPEIKQGLAAHLGVDESQLINIRIDMVLPLFKNKNEMLLRKGLYEPLMERQGAEFTALQDLQGTYFKEKTVGLRAQDDNINKSSIPLLNKAMKFLGIAEATKLAYQSGSNWLSMKNFASKQVNGFNRMWDEVEKGLSKKERNMLGAIAKEGDANEQVFDFASISPKLMGGGEIPAKVQIAYRKFRYVNDLAYEIADEGMVRSLRDTVFKYKGGHVQVQKGAKELHGLKKSDDILVKEFDQGLLGATGKPAFKIKAGTLQKEANTINTIIPYRTGHIPRSYRDQRFSVVIVNRKGGQVAYEATFDSNAQATQYFNKRNAMLGEDSDLIAIKIWNKADTGAGAVHMTRQSAKLLSQVDEVTAGIISKALRESGIEDDAVRVLFDKNLPPVISKALKARTIGVATTKKSQEARLALAKKPGSKEAQAEFARLIAEETPMTRITQLNYYSSVAHNAGYDNWRKFAFDDWSRRYGHLYEGGSPDPLLRLTKDKYLSPKGFGADKHRAEVREAIDYAKWLKRTIKDRDWFENSYDRVLVKISDDLARAANRGSISARVVSSVVDHLIPQAKELENSLRFVAAFPKLLTLNTAQIVVQGSQAALGAGAAFGFNPRLMVGSMWKLGKITGLEAARMLKIRAPKNANISSARSVHKEMIESGYLADLQTTDTAFGMRHGADPSAGRKFWEFTKTVGAVPFRFGEALNRSVAYVTVRDQIAYAIGRAEKEGFANLSTNLKRLASDFNGDPMTKADIGGHAFREAVVEKASILALNMGKAGELQLTSGVGSVAFQFKQVLAKEISVIDSTALTLREKVFGAGAMISLFGAGAIPLAGDLLKAADYFTADEDEPLYRMYFQDQANAFNKMLGDNLESFSNGFVSTEGVQRFFAKGAIAAASGGEIDFANRVALGNFMGETWDVKDPLEIVVSMAVLQDIVDASRKLGLTSMLNPLTMMYVTARVMGGDDFRAVLLDSIPPESTAAQLLAGDIEIGGALLALARNTGKVFSQVGSVSRWMDAANRDIVTPEAYWRNPYAVQTYMTSGLRGLPVERTRMRDLQFIWGITPGKIVEQYSKQKTERIYVEAIKKFGFNLEEKFKDAFGAPKLQNRIANDAITQLIALRKHLEDMGIDAPIPANTMKSVFTKINKLILDVQTGGRQ